MIEPVGAMENLFALARLEIDGEEYARQMSGEGALHHLALVARLIERMHLAGSGPGWQQKTRDRAFDIGAGGQGLIGVDRADAAMRRKRGDLACLAGINIGGIERVIGKLHVIDTLRFVAGGHDGDPPLNNGPRLERRQIEHRNTVRSGVDHLFVVCRIGIVVEIEAGAAGFLRETDDAVPGIGIDPGFGGIFRPAQHGHERQRQNPSFPLHFPAAMSVSLQGLSGRRFRPIRELRSRK